MAAYNASKFALNGFSEAMMQEVRHDNIKVSYICPGSVNTYFGGDTPSDEKAWQLQPEDIADVVVDLLSMDARALPSKIELRPANRRRSSFFRRIRRAWHCVRAMSPASRWAPTGRRPRHLLGTTRVRCRMW